MKNLIVFIHCLFLLTGTASTLIAEEEREKRSAKKDSATLLKEMVEIRQRILEGERLQLKAGMVTDIRKSEIALAKAKLRLARALKDSEGVVSMLRRIVEIQRHHLKRLENRTGDRVSQMEIDRVRIDLLQAMLRLAKYEESRELNVEK